LALGLVIVGSLLDRDPYLTQPRLYVAIHLAGFVGIGLAGAAVWPHLPTPAARIGFFPLAFLVWRVAYFPLMVFSGHAAAIGEWSLAAVGLHPRWIYPTFLLTLAAGNGLGVALSAGLLVGKNRKIPLPESRAGRLWRRAVVAPIVLPALLFAGLLSFTTPGDLRLLPDTRWQGPVLVPVIAAPRANPYRAALREPGYTLPQRALLLAAASTYATIPNSPWSTAVKGTLEAEFEADPYGGTSARIREHYLAYLAAHSKIGALGN